MPSLYEVQDLGVDPRSVPQEHSLCLARDLAVDLSSVPQEHFPVTQDLEVDPRSVPQELRCVALFNEEMLLAA